MFFLSKNHEKSSFHIHQGLEESCIKRLLLGVAFAANAGSVLLPISSTTTLITLSNWAVRAASASMTLLCACCFLGKWTWSFDFDVSFGFVLFLHFCGGLCLPKLMICIVAWYILSIVQSSCPFCVDRISCRLKLQGLLRDFDHRLSLGAGYSSLDLWHCSSLEILSNFSILSSSMALMALNFCPKRSDFFCTRFSLIEVEHHHLLVELGESLPCRGGC